MTEPVELLYENKLHDNLWQKPDASAPLLFLLGVVGSGKSTLINYYLHHHCNRPGVSEEYRKKLIVNVNLRNVRTPEELVERVYSRIRTQLIEKCAERGFDLLVSDYFRMWQGVLDFSSSVYVHYNLEDKRKAVAEMMRSITSVLFP